ncbi:oligosaccharide flippase family protein [Nevskia sp.]|uniref:oligosaccharide flippase family protein n=1 Tax=Nevskia sp. TaxID=1929292 RepID=UPI0025ED6722|nr:oligosaccharide flippase family protein [Nevskia sp.]
MKLPTLSPQAWLTLQLLFTQFFGLLLFAVQAPLLGPKAFGLISIVMVFIGFCEFVLEIASTDALISVKTIEPAHYRSMTTVNALFGLSLGVVVFVFADPIAALFGEPELAAVLRWMSVLPLVSALMSAPNAATRRAMQFKPVAVRGIISVAVGGVVGLVLALLDYGVWALVWQSIVQRVLGVAILWIAVPLPLRFGYSHRHFRELWPFASPMLISQTMAWAAGQIPRFILGLWVGATELGLFSLASRLNEILLQITLSPPFAVARVEMRRFLDDLSGIETAVHDLLRRMALLCFPLAIGGAAVMPVLFQVWLDERWQGGVLVAQLMLLTGLPCVTHYALSAALLGLNRQAATAANSTMQTVTTLAAVAVFAPLGLVPAVAALSFRPLLTAPVPMHYLRAAAGVSWTGVARAQMPTLISALIMGAAVWSLSVALSAMVIGPPVLVLVVQTAVGVVIYGALILRLSPEQAKPFVDRVLRRFRRRAA